MEQSKCMVLYSRRQVSAPSGSQSKSDLRDTTEGGKGSGVRESDDFMCMYQSYASFPPLTNAAVQIQLLLHPMEGVVSHLV